MSKPILNEYKEFGAVYAADWPDQREETNGDVVTLWHRIPELPPKYRAYVHTVIGSVKIGIHCLRDVTTADDALLDELLQQLNPTGKPDSWSRRRAKDRSTIEIVLDKNSPMVDWADNSELLKRAVRRHYWSQQLVDN
jgi:hypothetical protein